MTTALSYAKPSAALLRAVLRRALALPLTVATTAAAWCGTVLLLLLSGPALPRAAPVWRHLRARTSRQKIMVRAGSSTSSTGHAIPPREMLTTGT